MAITETYQRQLKALTACPKIPINNSTRELETSTNADIAWKRFNQNTGDYTPCAPFVKAFASTTEPGKVLCVELRCRSWKCKTCGPLLRFKWFQKQIGFLFDAGRLERKVICPSEWGKTRRALNRQSKQYMTYDRDNGQVLVITTGNIGGIRMSNDHKALQETLIQAIETTPLKKQPISQSRNWAKSIPASTVKEEKKWKALDSCNVRTLREVKEVVAEAGYKSYNYALEKDMFSTEKGLVFTLNQRDYYQVLWKLGIGCRDREELRAIGGPPQEIAA